MQDLFQYYDNMLPDGRSKKIDGLSDVSFVLTKTLGKIECAVWENSRTNR